MDVLSYRDVEEFDPPVFASSHRKLYQEQGMTASDVAFDAEMARRRLEAGQTAVDEPLQDTKVDVKPEPDERKIEDDIIDSLTFPPTPPLDIGFECNLRTSAIFLTSRLLGLLPTSSILHYAKLHCFGTKGIEWINDWSIVIVFNSPSQTAEAFSKLLYRPDEVEGENGIPEALEYLSDPKTPRATLEAAGEFILQTRVAKPLPESIFVKNSLPQDIPPQKLLPFIRFALNSDVKSTISRDQSLWYAVHGNNAGKENVENTHVFDTSSHHHHRQSRMHGGGDGGGNLLTKRLGKRDSDELDRQLDSYNHNKKHRKINDDFRNGHSHLDHSSTTRSNSRSRSRKSVSKPRYKPTATDLDAELDAFMTTSAQQDFSIENEQVVHDFNSRPYGGDREDRDDDDVEEWIDEEVEEIAEDGRKVTKIIRTRRRTRF